MITGSPEGIAMRESRTRSTYLVTLGKIATNYTDFSPIKCVENGKFLFGKFFQVFNSHLSLSQLFTCLLSSGETCLFLNPKS